uniref:Uncharacterized protein n=1 Tax=Glossina austeni TaxID=7395 RepID=A0A1A9UMC1_GLOAU
MNGLLFQRCCTSNKGDLVVPKSLENFDPLKIEFGKFCAERDLTTSNNLTHRRDIRTKRDVATTSEQIQIDWTFLNACDLNDLGLVTYETTYSYYSELLILEYIYKTSKPRIASLCKNHHFVASKVGFPSKYYSDHSLLSLVLLASALNFAKAELDLKILRTLELVLKRFASAQQFVAT